MIKYKLFIWTDLSKLFVSYDWSTEIILYTKPIALFIWTKLLDEIIDGLVWKAAKQNCHALETSGGKLREPQGTLSSIVQKG